MNKPQIRILSEEQINQFDWKSIELQENGDQICEVYNIIKSIKDPEFPYTLEQLGVVQPYDIFIKSFKFIQTLKKLTIFTCQKYYGFLQQLFVLLLLIQDQVQDIRFTCKLYMHHTININYIRMKLEKELSNFDVYKIDIFIKEGMHNDIINTNKQINDKERISGAQENKYLVKYIKNLIEET